MMRLPFLIVAGVAALLITLIAATLIAPLFGESVQIAGVVGEASRQRVGYGRYGRAPDINIEMSESTDPQIPWASDLGLGPVIQDPVLQGDLREGPGSIDSGLLVLRHLQPEIPQLQAVYEILVTSRSKIGVTHLRGAFGRYFSGSGAISIDTEVVEESNYAVAMILAHEGQHALDDREGRLGRGERACYNAEARAFDLAIFIWQSLWGMQGKAGIVSDIEADFNRMAAIRHEDPLGYVERLIELYGDNCQ